MLEYLINGFRIYAIQNLKINKVKLFSIKYKMYLKTERGKLIECSQNLKIYVLKYSVIDDTNLCLFFPLIHRI